MFFWQGAKKLGREGKNSLQISGQPLLLQTHLTWFRVCVPRTSLWNYYDPGNLSVQGQYSFDFTQCSKHIDCLPDWLNEWSPFKLKTLLLFLPSHSHSQKLWKSHLRVGGFGRMPSSQDWQTVLLPVPSSAWLSHSCPSPASPASFSPPSLPSSRGPRLKLLRTLFKQDWNCFKY